MSAWPEAVWIVKKIQQNFNFEDILNEYKADVDSARQEIAELGQPISALRRAFNIEIANKTMTYMGTEEEKEAMSEDDLVTGVLFMTTVE